MPPAWRACGGGVEELALRRFEKRLLNDLGYGSIRHDGDGVPVETAATTGSPR